jgi:Cu+-exporting ATPase
MSSNGCHHTEGAKINKTGRTDQGFVCPMHLEIRQTGPGTCPLCGMALEPEDYNGKEDGEEKEAKNRFLLSGLAALPVVILDMGHHWFSWDPVPASWNGWIQAVLATLVLLLAGGPFFARAWTALRQKTANMFTLIVLGTGTALVFSLFRFLLEPEQSRHQLYFEAVVVIITLVWLGQWLEARSRKITGRAIGELMNLAPPVAIQVTPEGDREVSARDIQKGWVLRVKPGSRIPMDGVVTEGTGMVDESMITGEGMPVEKFSGATVVGGTINLNGSFLIQVTQTGEDTVLATIIRLVHEARRTQPPIQRLVDRVAAIFVPAVLAVAILSAICWMLWGPEENRVDLALTAVVSVLIIACPCALGLAVPMAIVVAVGRGAQEGVLIRNAGQLERLALSQAVILDKTGTLTEGKPAVVEARWDESREKHHLASVLFSLEQRSEHPLARAVAQYAKTMGGSSIPLESFENHAGLGVSAMEKTTRWFLGVTPEECKDSLPIENTEGGTPILLRENDRPRVRLLLRDNVKHSARDDLAELDRLGLRAVMATGDHEQEAQRVAEATGVTEVRASLKPGDKLELVKELRQKTQRPVVMVGDGINDAPALAAADVGIAMGTGTDIAMQTAGITLVGGQLSGLIRSIRLARGTRTTIHRNLWLAFGYNSLAIPLAAGAFYPWTGWMLSPMIASAAMAMSSVSVILSSLLLRKAKPC